MRALLVLLGLCVFPHLAEAHAILMESDPAVHATVKPGQTQITLRFNSRIDAARSRVELRGGSGPVVLKLDRAGGPDVLTGQAALEPGEWVLRWQVLAVDGHITRGDVPFVVK